MGSTFETYAKIKQKLSRSTYVGIDLCGPSAALIANFLYSNQSVKKTKRKALKLLWRIPNYTNIQCAAGNVITWNTPRADHKKNVADLLSKLNNDNGGFQLAHIPDINRDYKTTFSLRPIWQAWRITQQVKIDKKHQLYAVVALTYCIRSYERLLALKVTNKIEKIISYNSSNSPECFLVAVCKKHKIPTFSLQHGLYHDYSTSPPLDVINYENVVADTLLVWSQFCRNEIIKFYARENRKPDFHMPIAGYLKTLPDLKEKKLTHSNTQPALLCLLPRNKILSSIQLLNVALEAAEAYQIIVRFHPNSEREEILKHVNTNKLLIDDFSLLEETLSKNKIELAIGFNTTSLFDTLLFNTPCALFNAADSILSVPELPSFSTSSQLRHILLHQQPTPEIADKVLGAKTSRYCEIINT